MGALAEIKHPVVDCICRSDGAIFVPESRRYGPAHWTFGSFDTHGYKQISIHGKMYKAHRLIAQAFIPCGDDKLVVDHIDRNRANNSVENLRWVTQKENIANSAPYDSAELKYGVHGDTRENKIQYAFRYNKAHPEQKRANDKAYYERNRDEILERARKRYALKRGK